MRGEVVVQLGGRGGWLRFRDPVEVVAAQSLAEVLAAAAVT